VAADAGAQVIREPQRGYEAACLAGARTARDAEVLVFLQADGNDDPAELPRVVQPLVDGRADLVLGSRTADPTDTSGLALHQRLGNRLVTRLLRLLYGLRLTDIGSFRAIRTHTFSGLGMEHKTYGWPVEMIVKAARKGYCIVEVPVSCHERRRGHSKVSGTLKGSLLAGYHLLVTTLRYAWWR
jgi:glycosyltransferase involved in cell wall biosynthesis